MATIQHDSAHSPGLDAALDEGPEPTADPGRSGRLPWREIVRFALFATLVMIALVAVDVERHGGGNPVSLLQPGTRGPAHALFHQDFPAIQPPNDVGLDGQLYYAIARDPLHPKAIAPYLDRPRYRLQHPLLSWLARVLHPTSGGGLGLTWALIAVGVLALFLGAVATGALSTALRGPPWLAVLLPLTPGAYWSLRVTVGDALALGLALAAIALAARSRTLPAVLVGILAVLAKEPTILLLAGWFLWHRTRRDALVVVVPGLVAGAWMLWLRILIPGQENTTGDFALPFLGVWHAYQDIWSHGHEWVGMACALAGFALGITALAVRRLSHPLSWIILLQLAYLSVMGSNPIGNNFGATRMAMPLMVLSLLALATPAAAEAVPKIPFSLRRPAKV